MILNVPGLFSYRKERKQLYVNEGLEWRAVTDDKEV